MPTFRGLVFRIMPGQTAGMFHDGGYCFHNGSSNRPSSVKTIADVSGDLSVTVSQAALVAGLAVTFCISKEKRVAFRDGLRVG